MLCGSLSEHEVHFFHVQVFWWQPNFRRSHSSTILLYVLSCYSWIHYCLLCRSLGYYTGIYVTLLGHYMGDYYRPQTKLWEGYVFTRVCDSVHRGRWYPSMHCMSLGPHRGWVGWGGMCIPACTAATLPPPQKQTATAAGGTHPTGMHSCLGCYLCYVTFTIFGSVPGWDTVTVPLGLWMFERPGELWLNRSWFNFRTVYY